MNAARPNPCTSSPRRNRTSDPPANGANNSAAIANRGHIVETVTNQPDASGSSERCNNVTALPNGKLNPHNTVVKSNAAIAVRRLVRA
ncbi:hypothetical protein ASA1KI_13030 [Opitutales bacterium ASA1]|nr:hypothetical protein ASA1KI_13030 [Opitutales bacterium ASA1]